MKKVEGISYLAKVCPNHVWRETIWVTFYEFEEIGWGSRFHVNRGDARHNKIIVVDIFKKVEQRADVRVALDLGAFYPVVVGILGSRFQKSSGIPWPANRKRMRGGGDGRHYVNFYGYRSVLGVSLPAVRKDTRLDDLFDDYGRLRSRWSESNFDPWGSQKKPTPDVPSSCISLARFTRPYAPLPISRSITNSEMLRSVRKGLGSLLGAGAPALATLRKLAPLFVRTSLVVAGGGGGGST